MLTNKSYGKRMMPEYLINFVRDIYEGPVPLSFGRSLVKEANIKKLETYYKIFRGTAKKNYGERMVPNYLLKYIEKLANADYIEYVDDSVAYIKETPQKALKYAFINKVGGMSYKSKNLLIPNLATTTINGVTCTNNGDGTYTLNGTSTAGASFTLQNILLPIGTYKMVGCINGSYDAYSLRLYNSATTYLKVDLGSGVIFTTESELTYQVFINVSTGITFDNVVFKPMITTDTILTYNDFQIGFEGIRDSAVTSVNDFTIASEIQALEGYGWGVDNTCYNYIDYDAKKFIQKVAIVDLGTLSWQYQGSYYYTNGISEYIKKRTSSTDIPKVISSNGYYPVSQEQIELKENELTVNAEGNIYILTTTSPTGSLYFELETPVETDISEYIKDNIIDVSSGELEFNNEYDNDVPSEVTYYVEA